MNFKKAILGAFLGAFVSFLAWEWFKDFINIKNQEVSYVGKIDQFTKEGFPDRNLTSATEFKSLYQIPTKITIVHFWASWCSPCIEEFPSLVRLAKDFTEHLSILAISLDESEAEYTAFLKSLNIQSTKNFLLLRDTDSSYADQIGTEKLPESYILDQNKKLIRKVPSAENWDSHNVREFLNYLIQK